MIASLIRRSIESRFLVLMATLMLTVWGVWSVVRTPLDAIPDLSDVQVIIRTTYPGQAPQIVENQVTYPLTTTMLSVPGAKAVRGYSMFGDSFVYILFEDGTDPYWARSRVLEYLNQVQSRLPPQAGQRPDGGIEGAAALVPDGDGPAQHLLRRPATRRGEQPGEGVFQIRLGPLDVEVVAGPRLQAGPGHGHAWPSIDDHHRQLRVGLPQRGKKAVGRGPRPRGDHPQIPRVAGKRGHRLLDRFLHADLEGLEAGRERGVGKAGGSLGVDDENAGLLHGVARAGVAGNGLMDGSTACRPPAPARE